MLSAAAAGRASRRGLDVAFFGALPLLCLGVIAWSFAFRGFHTFDFRTFWESGRAVLHGRSPYPRTLPAHANPLTFRPFVYPAPAAVAMAPFALLPFAVADVLFAIVGAAAFAAALHVLGVRDWRCYGAAFLTWPVLGSLNTGAITLLLVLGGALLWTRRSSPWRAGALLAGLVALKVFLWPLAIWLLATRRPRATAISVATCVAGTLGAWALVGFSGLRDYPALLGRLTDLVGPQSYSPYAFALSLGAPRAIAHLAADAAGALLLGGVVVVARRRDGDRRAFTLALAAALVLSPVVWSHYLALLFVPLALAWRRVAAPWLLPVAFWLVTNNWSHGSPAPILALLGLAALVVVASLLPHVGEGDDRRTALPHELPGEEAVVRLVDGLRGRRAVLGARG
jgi:hypothetical protein